MMKNGDNVVGWVVRRMWPHHAYAGLNIAGLLKSDMNRTESKVFKPEFYFSIKNIRTLK